MRRIRAFLIRLGSLFRKRYQDRQLAEEIESHLQLHIDDNLRAGMSPEEARRQALLRLGGVEQTIEAYRDRRSLPLESLAHDLGYGARTLIKHPGFTIVTVFTLALGIGATTVIFSVLDNVLFRTFPYKDSDRLTTVYEHFVSGALDRPWLAPEEVVDFKEQNHSFEDLIAYSLLEIFYNRREGTQWNVGARVTPNTFEFLGVKPLLVVKSA
jgi:macrolide transport system ATP-binding/permease protein